MLPTVTVRSVDPKLVLPMFGHVSHNTIQSASMSCVLELFSAAELYFSAHHGTILRRETLPR